MQTGRTLDEITADVKAAQKGDAAAMDRILKDVQDPVYYTCLRTLRDKDAAQDAAQEIMIAVFTKLEALRDPSAYIAWVNRITANCCKAHLKAPREASYVESGDGRGLYADPNLIDEKSAPEKVLETERAQQIIEELIDSLPDEQRMCILLHYYDGMKTREIAEAIGVSEGTVKSRLNYARKAIRAGVKKYEKEGIKLYGLSPIPFLSAILRRSAKAHTSPVTASVVRSAAQEATAETAASATAAKAAAGGTAAAIAGKILAGILSVGLLAGIGFGVYMMMKGDPPKAVEQEPIETENPDESEEPVPEETPRAEDEADGEEQPVADTMELYNALLTRARTMANANDYNAYRTLFTDPDADLSANFAAFRQHAGETRSGFVAAEENGLSWIAYETRGADGTRGAGSDAVRMTDGALLFANDAQALSWLSDAQEAEKNALLARLFPAYGTAERVNEADLFNGNFTWLNGDATSDGAAYDVLYLWQNADGDVMAAVCFHNGTDAEVDASVVHLSASDGTRAFLIADADVETQVRTVAKRTTVFGVTVPATEIMGGTAAWGTVAAQAALYGSMEQASAENGAARASSVQGMFAGLYQILQQAKADGDANSFSERFYQSTGYFVDSLYSTNDEFLDSFSISEPYVVGESNGSYVVSFVQYVTEEGSMQATRGYRVVRLVDGQLMVSASEAAERLAEQVMDEAVVNYMEELLPGAAEEIASAQNVYRDYGTDVYFLSGNASIPGFDVTLFIMAWQLENGDVRIAIVRENGTAEDVTRDAFSIRMDDGSIGTIIDGRVPTSARIPAGKSVVQICTIPADEVLTGTARWTMPGTIDIFG